MKPVSHKNNIRVTQTIESRSPAGSNDTVRGWHNYLKKVLSRMAPYLREGQLVTFRKMEDHETAFFETLHQKINVPTSVCAIYLPPSVRFHMMYHRAEGEPQRLPDHSADDPPDQGIVLACRKGDVDVIINALFARPPFAPAVDVYEHGELIAGYVYNTIDECTDGISKILRTHLRTDDM